MGKQNSQSTNRYSNKQLSIFRWIFYIISAFALFLAFISFPFSKVIGTFFFAIFALSFCMGSLYGKLIVQREKAKSKEKYKILEETSPLSFKPETSMDQLDSLSDRTTVRVPKIGECIEVYSYIKFPITVLDRTVLQQMYNTDQWNCTFEIDEGIVNIVHNGIKFALITNPQKREMISDWLVRGDPIRCELTGTHYGKEHIILAFYRNEEKRLENREKIIIKLISYHSEEKQDGISHLVEGEKLTIKEDEFNFEKVVFEVLDWCQEPIGKLPAKYAKMYLDQPFSGVFFDHAEYDEENDIYIPYIRFYK